MKTLHSCIACKKQSHFQRPKIPKRFAYFQPSSSPLACQSCGLIQASNHPAHHIGRFAPPGCLCLVTPELSTTPRACAVRCRLNLLSLISPDTVSRTLRSAGVGHRFYNCSQPLVGIVECKKRILPIPYSRTILVSRDVPHILQIALSVSPNPSRKFEIGE